MRALSRIALRHLVDILDHPAGLAAFALIVIWLSLWVIA